MTPRLRSPGPHPDDGQLLATLATALAQLDEYASVAAERDLLGPVYAAAEALLLGAAGGVARGQEALERAVGDLAKDGIEEVGPRVTLSRSYRRLGREVAVLVHAALADARALEPSAAEPERTTPVMDDNYFCRPTTTTSAGWPPY